MVEIGSGALSLRPISQLDTETALKQMSYESVWPLLNDVFVLQGEHWDGIEAVLVEVKEIIRKAPALPGWQRPRPGVEDNTHERQSFNLVFRFPVDCEASQGTYSIKHPIEV